MRAFESCFVFSFKEIFSNNIERSAVVIYASTFCFLDDLHAVSFADDMPVDNNTEIISNKTGIVF
ncbi:hypothetical protein SDC9_186004 [bioreactor metagenome]|uniref:Uncharacterized protein n=1 Tax=bioreactor metagenome TaxID=1076179 RepID=A0A645HIB0_9ZZZZ